MIQPFLGFPRRRPSSGFANSRALQLQSASSHYLSKSLTTFTNNKIGTFSCFLKRASIGASMYLLSPNEQSGPTGGHFRLNSSNKLEFTWFGSGSTVTSNEGITDTTAFHHIVCAFDTTQATAANRVKLYLDGTECTYGTANYPTQNLQVVYNTTWTLGRLNYAAVSFLDGIWDELSYVDGLMLTPSAFASGNLPIAPAPSDWGTSGFWLRGEDNTSTTTMGQDSSGKGNNFTLNGMSTASSVTTVP